jgi:hydrogenase nickel incorporation protein HypA/HybF
MHEVTIAEALLDVALAHARGRRIARVQVAVGRLRQVVPSALAFAWEMSARETAAEGAALGITQVAAAGRCRRCGAAHPLPAFPFACAACGSLEVQVTRGEELQIEWLEVEEGADG